MPRLTAAFLGAMLLLIAAVHGEAPSTQPAPIPDPAAQARAHKLLKEVFQKEYVQRSPADRQNLARRLLQQARSTQDDAAARFVLLSEARDLAAGAGDAPLAAAAIRQLCAIYGVEPVPTMFAALQVANRTANSPQAFSDISRIALLTADQAVLIDDYAAASQLASLAEGAAEKARDVLLVDRTRARAKELGAMFLEFQRVKAARQALANYSGDAAANLLLGRFLCFVKADWSTGLPHLVKGADPDLKRLAQTDLATPTDPRACYELASAWWDQAQAQTGLPRRNLQRHAAHWYQLALPSLTGLSRATAEERLRSTDLETLAEMNLHPGLLARLYKGTDFVNFVGTRIDSQIDFDWGNGAPDPALPKDNFSIRWTGVLRPPKPGRYDLILIANAGATLWLDDKLILDGPNLSRHRNGQRISVDLSADFHRLRIDYWDTLGLARMKFHWQPPAASQPQPIPASVLFHDPSM